VAAPAGEGQVVATERRELVYLPFYEFSKTDRLVGGYETTPRTSRLDAINVGGCVEPVATHDGTVHDAV
jgi:hypothetical protein